MALIIGESGNIADVDSNKRLKNIAAIVDSTGAFIATVTSDGRLKTDAATTVTVESLLGQDDFADTFFKITNAGSAGNTIRVRGGDPIGSVFDVTTTLTSSEVGNVNAAASLVVSTLNANSTFNSKYSSKVLQNIVFVTAKTIAEGGELKKVSTDTFQVDVTGTTTVLVETINKEIVRRKKIVQLFPDPVDPRIGTMNIRGEVGSVAKADNPINISVRKSLAATSETPFKDLTAIAPDIYYILSTTVADDLAAEFKVYQGDARAAVELFSGNGSQAVFTLTKNAISHSTYITVKVGGVLKTLDTHYTIDDSPTDETKTQVTFKSNQIPPSGTNNIEVTYDKVTRRADVFVQGSSTTSYIFQAPLKLRGSKSEFVVMTVQNKAGTAAIVAANLSGFIENENLE